MAAVNRVSLAERQDMEPKVRLTLVESDQANHEEACAARWGVLIKIVVMGGTGMITAVCGVVGWSLAQIHSDQQKQIELIQTALNRVPEVRVIAGPVPGNNAPELPRVP